MGMSAGGGGGLQSEINVTPMVDIMLVLLIIFMVVTPFLQQGVSVAIPRDMNSPDVDQNINKDTAVIVAIPDDNQYYLGKTPISKDDLGADIKGLMEKKNPEDQIVYIKCGVNVSYGQLVDIIDIIRRKGEVQQIGLVADKKKKGATQPAPAT
jgi:biopolymer transport protein ExbD/biopolymer transport protein TolR